MKIERIGEIDAYRGLMLLMMSVNHLLLFPFIQFESLHSLLIGYVYSPFGFLSNSEGFFFLAGIISGIVYGKMHNQDVNISSMVRSRIVKMYLINLFFLFGFALLLSVSDHYSNQWLKLHELVFGWKDGDNGLRYFIAHPWEGALLGSLFLYLPSFMDILPIYMLFLGFTPLLLNHLGKGRIVWVLLGSFCLWLASLFMPLGFFQRQLEGLLPVSLSWFNPFAVQLLFVTGLTSGFLVTNGKFNIRKAFLWAFSALAISFIFCKLTQVDMLSISKLGFWRVAVFCMKALLAVVFASFFNWEALRVLGRHSLSVFTYHVVLVYGLIYFLPANLSEWQMTPLFILSLISLWLPAYYLERKSQKSLALV